MSSVGFRDGADTKRTEFENIENICKTLMIFLTRVLYTEDYCI